MKSISTRYLAAIALLTVGLMGVEFYQSQAASQALLEKVTSEQAKLALEFDLAIRRYVSEHVRPEMEKHVGKDEFIPESMSTSFVARSVFEAVREKFPDYMLKFSSQNPRNPANLAGPEEVAILDYFRQHPAATVWTGRTRIEGRDYWARFSPRRMDASCMRCHGEVEDAPRSMVERYGPAAGFHGKIGDLIAMDAIGIPLEKIDAGMAQEAGKTLRTTAVLAVLWFGSIFLLFRRIVTRRLAAIAGHFREAAEQPQQQAIKPIPVTGSDEISVLASSFNTLAARLAAIQQSLERRVQERTAELEVEVAERKRAEEEKRGRLDRARRQQSAIVAISTSPAVLDGDVDKAFKSITELSGAALEVERTAIWRISDDRKELRCADRFCRSENAHSSGTVLPISETAHILGYLNESRVFGIEDAKADPRLRGFLESYLIPEDITSIVLASIRLSGNVVGFFGCATTGSKQCWTDDESAFAGQVADQVSQVLANQHRKQSEEALRQHAAELETANRALAETTRAAEAATVAKSDFLANMSHEIRTPMTAIMGFAEVLRDQAVEAECVEAADTIKRNGAYLLDIINRLLDVAKIEAGKMEKVTAACDPTAIVRDVSQLMRRRATEKGLTLEVDYPGLLPPSITTDPALVRQILVNLVGNAIKFTEQGGIRIEVRLLGNRVPVRIQFSVIDTGGGMTAEQMACVFQPFTQGDTSTTRRYGGTGLGLTISKQLAAFLGGDLAAQSSPGRGSRFDLEIPVGSPSAGPASEADPPQPSQDTEDSPEALPRLEGRVLLVEDGLDNQRLLSLFLRRAGAEVALAVNGQEAVEMVLDGTESFDLILMDMQMPVMDGYQATSKLRAEGYQGTIVALTAHAMDHHRDKCLDAGCNGYITKPVDRSTMLHAVNAYLMSSTPQTTGQPVSGTP